MPARSVCVRGIFATAVFLAAYPVGALTISGVTIAVAGTNSPDDTVTSHPNNTSAPSILAAGGIVADAVADRVRRLGPLPFDQYLELVLYDDEVGFYQQGGSAGRARGDFVTSPEVGPLFGQVVARALDGWWSELGRPDPFVVVDAGAGPGPLAVAVAAAEPADEPLDPSSTFHGLRVIPPNHLSPCAKAPNDNLATSTAPLGIRATSSKSPSPAINGF